MARLLPRAGMAPDPKNLPETHSVGSGTFEERISRAMCPPLGDHGINLAGFSNASPEFAFVRWNPGFTQLLVSLAGEGMGWDDGEFVSLPPGTAYLTPPRHFHAYHTARRAKRWEVGWVVIPVEAPSQLPFLPAGPLIIETDTELMRAALTGLCHEMSGRADLAMLEAWARLIRGLTSRIASAAPHDELIDQLWRKVASRLSDSWTLASMTAALGCSEEHLRRLCQQRYGCSPMKRLASLRMQHAASLLTETHLTIAAIARAIGYENEFAFSVAFKRWSRGQPPSAYRRTVHTGA